MGASLKFLVGADADVPRCEGRSRTGRGAQVWRDCPRAKVGVRK